MRKAYLDRSPGDRRLGMRRAAVAAWMLVFALFGLVVAAPSLTGGADGRSAASGHPIDRLVARAVPQDGDACLCTQFDRLEMTQATELC